MLATRRLLKETEAAAYLRITVKTLQAWRLLGKSVIYVKIGRCVRYRPEDLEAMVVAGLRSSTSNPVR
jgi:hypothetical protein